MPVKELVDRLQKVGRELRKADWDQWEAEYNRFCDAINTLDEELRTRYGYALAGFRVTAISHEFHAAIGSSPKPEEIATMEQLLRQQGMDPEDVRQIIERRVTTIIRQTVSSMELLLVPIRQINQEPSQEN